MKRNQRFVKPRANDACSNNIDRGYDLEMDLSCVNCTALCNVITLPNWFPVMEKSV